MNANDHNFITSLYDSEDGYASSYSTTIDEKLDSSTSNEVLASPTSDKDCELSSSEREEEVDPFIYCLARS